MRFAIFAATCASAALVAGCASQSGGDEIVLTGSSVVLDVDGLLLTYHILGLWDSEPETGIISYATDIAKALISRKRGDEVELPQGQTAVISEVTELPAHVKAWVQIDAVVTAEVAK